jgi:ribulose 1,5-bisphosphate synthetase/thiazole synthase
MISIISTSKKKLSNIYRHLTSTMNGFIQGQTDVLIVGAGPAGCMAASTLAIYGIDFRLIDKRAQEHKLDMLAVRKRPLLSLLLLTFN